MTDTSTAAAAPLVVPRLADGVQLLGPMAGSGYRTPPHLARRGDGQVLQLSPLLAAVAAAVDGQRDVRAIGAEVGRTHGRALHPDDVVHLLEHRLAPLGLLRQADGTEPVVRRTEPLLGLRARFVLTSPAQTRAITRPFLWLFRPAVVTVVLVAFAAVSAWVTLRHGLGLAVDDALADPRTVLALVALILASGAFHEVGHAAACRYGGAQPGVMGAAVYLVWPAFYTDVTDSYRLDRRGRLRVDLGGLYFNAVFTLATVATWAVTGREALLVLVPVQLLQMVRQLVPVVRFDGYHILADLVGVPDLYARIRPTLRRALPWRHDPEPNPLTRRAQIVVVTWVVAVVPVLLVSLGLLLWGLPALLGSAVRSLDAQSELFRDNVGAGRVAASALGAVAMVTVAFVPVSAVYLLARLAHRSGARFWTLTERRPGVRAGAVALAAVVAVAALPGLVPAPSEAPPDLASAAVDVDGSDTELAAAGPSRFDAAERRVEPAPTAPAPVPEPVVAPPPPPEPEPEAVLASAAPPPAPATTPVSVPVVRPAWPFPFDRPAPPAVGGNQAFALATQDGSRHLVLETSLEWDDDGVVDNRNEAWALASCVDCEAVAVAFQVVAATAPAATVVPQNLAIAHDQTCERCRAVAVAVQLDVTLEDAPSPEVMAQVGGIVDGIDARGEAFAEATPEAIRAELVAAKAEVLALLEPWLAEAPSPEAPTPEADQGAVEEAPDAGEVAPAAEPVDPVDPEPAEAPPVEGTADTGAVVAGTGDDDPTTDTTGTSGSTEPTEPAETGTDDPETTVTTVTTDPVATDESPTEATTPDETTTTTAEGEPPATTVEPDATTG